MMREEDRLQTIALWVVLAVFVVGVVLQRACGVAP
jgi:hypothetical protein